MLKNTLRTGRNEVVRAISNIIIIQVKLEMNIMVKVVVNFYGSTQFSCRNRGIMHFFVLKKEI